MNRRVRTIALHEYVTNVRRKEFLFLTLGLPVLMVAIVAVSSLGTLSAFRGALVGGTMRVGLVDRSGQLRPPARIDAGEIIYLDHFADLAASQEALKSRRVEGVIETAPDYLQSGRVTIYRRKGGLLSRADAIPVGAILTRSLLARTSVTAPLAERIVAPAGGGAAVMLWDPKTRRFAPRTGAGEAAKFLVPYLFSILFLTSIFISASYLLRGIADEKENRVIEVILSSVTPEELLLGKLIGLAAVGLTQVGLWMSLAALPAAALLPRAVHVPAAALAGIVLYFALGFALFATLMAGIGALGTSYRETQQISGIVSMVAFLPYMLIAVIIEFPNGGLARALSFIPFTAPTTMVLRLSAADVPPADIVISSLSIALATWLVLKLSAKLFRFGLLIYGKRPSLRETLRWLRQS